MKWNHAIIAAFILFIGMMMTLVVKSMQTEFHLVAENYYEEELAYQQVIDATRNAYALKKDLEVQVNSKRTELTLRFNNRVTIDDGSGKLQLYRPENARFDQYFELESGNLDEITINTRQLVNGRYIIKCRWMENGKPFYIEKSIYL